MITCNHVCSDEKQMVGLQACSRESLSALQLEIENVIRQSNKHSILLNGLLCC